MTYTQQMFSNTFRILESGDEHFYSGGFHWPLHGMALPDAVLRKLYRENFLRAVEHARKNA